MKVGGMRLETSSSFLAQKAYHRPNFTGVCVKSRGVWFHRIRDLKQYNFNSVPPTSHLPILGIATCSSAVEFSYLPSGRQHISFDPVCADYPPAQLPLGATFKMEACRLGVCATRGFHGDAWVVGANEIPKCRLLK